MTPRMLIINGGLHHEKAFRGHVHPKTKLLHVGKLREISLNNYDIVVVPFHTDQIALHKNRKKLETFVKRGGVLVILGATQEGERSWMPYCQWEPPFTTKIEMNTTTQDGHAIFKGFSSPTEFKYHGIYYAHGALLPTLAEDDVDVLARGERNRIVMFVRRSGLKGTLFCTTLDPDFHAVAQVPGPRDSSTPETHQRASKLLRNIIYWAIEEARKKPLYLRLVRRTAGFVANLTHGLLFWITLFLPAVVVAFWLLRGQRYQLPEIVVALSVIGVLDSMLSIWQLWKDRKSDQRS